MQLRNQAGLRIFNSSQSTVNILCRHKSEPPEQEFTTWRYEYAQVDRWDIVVTFLVAQQFYRPLSLLFSFVCEYMNIYEYNMHIYEYVQIFIQLRNISQIQTKPNLAKPNSTTLNKLYQQNSNKLNLTKLDGISILPLKSFLKVLCNSCKNGSSHPMFNFVKYQF